MIYFSLCLKYRHTAHFFVLSMEKTRQNARKWPLWALYDKKLPTLSITDMVGINTYKYDKFNIIKTNY